MAELLRMRTVLALEATRLSATYATSFSLAPARALFSQLSLETDTTRHALLELDMFRALVMSSAMWPAVWLGNAFWGPMREMHERFAPTAGFVPKDYRALSPKSSAGSRAKTPKAQSRFCASTSSESTGSSRRSYDEALARHRVAEERGRRQ